MVTLWCDMGYYPAGKIFAMFWDFKGTPLVEFLHKWQKINSDYYCELLDKTETEFLSNRRCSPIRSVIPLPDKAHVTYNKMVEIHWDHLDYPSLAHICHV